MGRFAGQGTRAFDISPRATYNEEALVCSRTLKKPVDQATGGDVNTLPAVQISHATVLLTAQQIVEAVRQLDAQSVWDNPADAAAYDNVTCTLATSA